MSLHKTLFQSITYERFRIMSINNIPTKLNIGFIGFGLIGGSIAKSIKKKHPDYVITVTSRHLEPVIMAKNEGIVDIAAPKADDSFKDCDFIFICTPVITINKYLNELIPIKKESCIITDVGSVKGSVHIAANSLGLSDCFIGGHPMAGSEQSGYASSSANLLCGAKYVITTTEQTGADKLNAYKKLVEDMGAVPIIMDYRIHDKTVAGISHLPHLVSAALAKVVADNDDENHNMHTLAAGGFKDTTRIAASSPEMWSQICQGNNEAICFMLEKYIDQLSEIKTRIEKGKENPAAMSEYIETLFDETRKYRNTF